MKIRRAVIKVLFCLCFFETVYGSVPTMEGLFRNGGNNDLAGNFVVVKMLIEQISNENALAKVKVGENSDQRLNSAIIDEKVSPHYVKLIFSLENEKKTGFIQIEYSNRKMRKNSLIRSLFIPNFLKRLREDTFSERLLFYSSIMMFSMNDSRGMGVFLRKQNIDFKMNSEVMNVDKIRLLEKYKQYLAVVKGDLSLKQELESPLNPYDEDQKTKVTEILKTGMYNKSDRVLLVRKNRRFFWKVSLENTEAFFFNDTHRLDSLKVNLVDGSIELNCGDYISFDGGAHQFPRELIFKDLNEKVYSIKIISFKDFTNSGKKIVERARDYKEVEKKNALRSKNEKLIPDQTRFFIY